MPKILSFEENKTFAKSNLLDLCTYLNACQIAFMCYFKFRFLLAEVLSNCGCFLYYGNIWQLAIRHVTWRIHCANYKKHPSIIKLSAQGDSGASQGCRLGRGSLLSIAHPHFFFCCCFWFLFFCLIWSHHRPGPVPGECDKLTGAMAQKGAGFCSLAQGKGPLWQHSPGLALWSCDVGDACVGKKRFIIEIDSRWALFLFIDNNFFHPFISQPWSRIFCRKEVTVHFWNCSSCLPVSHPHMPGI